MSIYDDKPWLNHYDDGVDPEVTGSADTSYADLFNSSVKSNPAAPALHFMGVTFSYGELDDLTGRFAAYLTACGVAKGDVVGINLPNIIQIVNWIDYQYGREVMCSAFPLFHMAGLMVGMASLTQNTPQCLIPDPRNTKHICNEIKTYHPTTMTNVPSLYQMLMETPEFASLDFSMCKAFLSGAAPFAVESIVAFEEIVGKGQVLEVYGMTKPAQSPP